MTKPQYNLSSDKRLQQAERPKSFALSIMPKSSLNDAVDAWVASGGEVTMVTMAVRRDVPVALNRKQCKIRKKDK